MTVSLKKETVVIAANQFNPSIITDRWLTENGITRDDEADDSANNMYTPVIVQVKTKTFSLLVMPDKLHFAPFGDDAKKEALINSRLKDLVVKLPHTPYLGAGLNFHWKLDSESDSIGAFARRTFFPAEMPFAGHFGSDDSRFGAYFSEPFKDGRLKLDVKPFTHTVEGQEPTEFLQFLFNFHFDLTQPDIIEKLTNALSCWGDAHKQSQQMMNDLAT